MLLVCKRDFLQWGNKWFCKHSMWTNPNWWKKWKVLGMATVVMEPQWQSEPCFWYRDMPADWLTDSLSGSPWLFLLKCWNLRFFIVLWKGSLPVMQETERLPSSKNARFPGSIPRAPSLDRSQNISSFRIQGHCIFILILFFPQRFQEVKRELQLFLRSWLCVLSGPWPDV